MTTAHWQDVLRQNRQSILFFAGLLLLASIASLAAVQWLPPVVAQLVLMLVFSAAGWLHQRILQTGLNQLSIATKNAYSLLLAGFVVALLMLGSLFSRIEMLAALSASCVFLLPYCLQQVWESYEETTVSTIPVAFLTEGGAAQKSTTFLNSVPVRLKVIPAGYYSGVHRISFRAPVRMPLNLLVFHALQQHNQSSAETVHTKTLTGDSYAWVFFTQNFLGGRRYLHPESGLLQNGVKENSVIVVQQLPDAWARQATALPAETTPQ